MSLCNFLYLYSLFSYRDLHVRVRRGEERAMRCLLSSPEGTGDGRGLQTEPTDGAPVVYVPDEGSRRDDDR